MKKISLQQSYVIVWSSAHENQKTVKDFEVNNIAIRLKLENSGSFKHQKIQNDVNKTSH